MVKKWKMMVMVGMMAIGLVAPVALTAVGNETAYAEVCARKKDGSKVDELCVDTNVLPNKSTMESLLKTVVNILLYGLGAAATLGVVIAGVLYLTARDNPQQVARAKSRLIEIGIGLLAWAMLFTLLQFLWPGFTWN